MFCIFQSMRKIITLLSIFCTLISFSQEMEDDLFQTWSSNTISDFLNSEFKKMKVTTNRWVKGEVVPELITTYKKSKFNPNKVNFSIDYTEYYIVEERKKSNGRYLINGEGKIYKYERTDIGEKNRMLGTFYHTYIYKKGVLLYDRIRYKEYVNVGAVEMDTIVSYDSLVYKVNRVQDTIYQIDELSKNTRTYYVLNNNQLVERNNFISGYTENLSFSYNKDGKLAMIVFKLKSNDGKSIKNVLKLTYSSKGLVDKTQFFDQTNALIEEKLFSYK